MPSTSHTQKVKIHPSWKVALASEFEADYFKALSEFVRSEYAAATIYPAPQNVFKAFDACPFDQVKVVILGQDPYHGPRQANGLCFAVNEGVTVPPSLKNMYKEIEADLGQKIPPELRENGDLSRWATQGVLLLNATLTVRASTPGSHQGKGWEQFTDAAVRALSAGREGLVFMLWGNYAKQKGAIIDRAKHLVLEAAHPSPFSAYNGFFGCKHFSKANEYLRKRGAVEVRWV